MMQLLKKGRALALIFGGVLALTACGQGNGQAGNKESGSTKETASQEASNKEYKDTLNIAMGAQPPTLDAGLTASNAANNVAGNIFEQLLTMNEDYVPTPELAESVEPSEDGLTYTFHLRKGVKFHNDKEMTADDVVASMNRWLSVSDRLKHCCLIHLLKR
ncbi:MAG: ABC transporter substrate-binding protein [Lacrimispora sp.]